MASDDLIVVDDTSAWQDSNKRKRKRKESDDTPDKARGLVPSLRKQRTAQKTACSICAEEFTLRLINRLNCDCGLLICRPCFNKWINTTGDLPECCGTKMRREDYEHILNAANKKELNSRAEELADPDPKYCAYCYTHLKDDPRSQFNRCRKCKTKTCKKCDQEQEGHPPTKGLCPRDVQDPGLDELAEKFGWRQCPKCLARIERSYGCDEMKCRCGGRFKYCCGRTTKKCTCAMDRNANRVAESPNIDVPMVKD